MGIKLEAGRLFVADRFVYFSTALWRMPMRPTPGLRESAGGDIGVSDDWVCYYDPVAVEAWSVAALGWALHHEIRHLLFEHAARSRAMNVTDDERRIANLAADCELNQGPDLADATFPYEIVTPKLFGLPEGELFEFYLTELRKLRAAGQDPTDKLRLLGPGSGNCGSAATGVRESHEQPADAAVSTAEGELLRHTVAQAIQEHARTRGDVPADLLRWAGGQLAPPKVDWRRELAACVQYALVRAAGKADYSYAVAHRRRSLCGSVLLPGLIQPIPQVAVVADTSGSMDDAALQDVLSEVRGILSALSLREGVTVLSCDADVHNCQRVFSVEQVKLQGGGGTNLRVGIDQACALHPRPHIVVVLTDAGTPWPSVAPQGTRTIIVVVGGNSTKGCPEWARVIQAE